MTPAATDSLTLWHHIALCFLLMVDDGTVLFVITLILSAKTFVAPVMGMPNILSLYLIESFMSTACLIATNSLLKVDDSTVFCPLLYHKMGALFTKIITPVLDLLINLFPAWSESTHIVMVTAQPLGFGQFGGIASLTSP